MSLETEGDKWIAKIVKFDRDMPDTMENLDSDELKQRVLQSQRHLMENERKKAADRKLSAVTAQKKELEAPYKEVKDFQSAIVQYGMLLLEARGETLGE